MKRWSKFTALFRKEKLDAEMAEEMREHLEQRTQANIAAGMPPDEARYAAQRQFGGVEQLKEVAREQRGGRWVEEMLRDLRHCARMMVKQPGFTATAVLTVAICLGANVAVFALVDAILLRSLPFPEPDRLVSVFSVYPRAGYERSSASIPNYYDRRGAIEAFSSIAIHQESSVIVGEATTSRRVPVARISPEFFATLGAPLAMGSSFTEAALSPGSDNVAVLTDGFWRSHFGADPGVIGRTFLNDGAAITVAGVLPRRFRFLSSRAEFFRPVSHPPEQRHPRERHNNNVTMIARLAPGATLAAAQSQIDAFNARQLIDDPFGEIAKGAGYRTWVHGLHADHVREVKPMLVLVQCGVLALLLIGAVNLANLFLIRASARAKEFAVRQALGASGWRIARAVVVETTLLGAAGGLVGLGFGAIGIRLLAALGTDRLPLAATIGFDARLALLSFSAAVAIGALLAVPMIWLNLRARLTPGLQLETRGGTASPAAQQLRHTFIVAQVALAFVLLSSAGLLGLSLKRVLETPAGFDPKPILTGQMALSGKNYRDHAARLGLVERLLPALRALPEVTHVAINSSLPFGASTEDSAVRVEGNELKPGETIRAHYISWVRGDYWAAMGIPLVRGRLLDDADIRSRPRVCVVDEAFARRYWPGADPIGRRLANNGNFSEAEASTVVGVVAEVKQKELAEAAGHGAVYFPYANFNARPFTLILRSSLPPAALVPTIRKTIQALDPELPVDDLRPMQARIDESLIVRRSPAILAAVFAGVALLLAAIGTYGVLAYTVNQRQREIGVRMALGASPRHVLTQFLRLGGKLLLAGFAFGLFGAWAAGRAMQSVIVDTGSAQIAIIALTAFVLGVVVLLASLLPSRRAARISPMEALRAE